MTAGLRHTQKCAIQIDGLTLPYLIYIAVWSTSSSDGTVAELSEWSADSAQFTLLMLEALTVSQAVVVALLNGNPGHCVL